jgi:putative zinc finger protein
MPAINSPKVTMANDDLQPRSRGKAGILPARKWSCPEDNKLAAYADSALRDMRKKWIEFHLSGCPRCRFVVAEAVKAQREQSLPQPPAHLRWKATGLAVPSSARRRWIWVPAGGLAAVAVLVLAVVFLRRPESLVIQTPPSPSAPIIAKSEPMAAPATAIHDIVRKPTSSEVLPSIVLPRPNSVVSRGGLKFGWKAIAQSRYYEVRLVTTDGDLVWQGQTERSNLQMPADIAVRDGSYFVWITAHLADGRTAKSGPVKFVLKQ